MNNLRPLVLLFALCPALSFATGEEATESSAEPPAGAAEAGEVEAATETGDDPLVLEGIDLFGTAEEAEAEDRSEEEGSVPPASAAFQPQAGEERSNGAPDQVYQEWWFWAAAAGVALLAGGAVYAGTRTDAITPYGSLGTIDWRR